MSSKRLKLHLLIDRTKLMQQIEQEIEEALSLFSTINDEEFMERLRTFMNENREIMFEKIAQVLEDLFEEDDIDYLLSLEDPQLPFFALVNLISPIIETELIALLEPLVNPPPE